MPLLGTFYYPWTGGNPSISPNPSETYRHWLDDGHNPPLTWASNYLPDVTPGIVTTDIKSVVENVKLAVSYKYGSRDDIGNSMDTAKIIEIDNPTSSYKYLAVYHTLISGVFKSSIADSTDLINWRFRKVLDNNASQATIFKLSNDGFLVALEASSPGTNHLRVNYYSNINNLLNNIIDRSIDIPQTLSTCAEGTPNIYSVTFSNPSSPIITQSIIDIGFHYYKPNLTGGGCDVDRQARGILTNFTTWNSIVETAINTSIESFGVKGNIGDRDYTIFNGVPYNIIEGQYIKNDFGSWKCFLWNWQTRTASQLNIQTHKGSLSLANPTYTKVRLPDGRTGMVVCIFIFSQNSATGEAGELIYYFPIVENGFDTYNRLYSSKDIRIINNQLSLMKRAGIEFVISSWWGQNSYEDQALDIIFNQVLPSANNPYSNVKFCIYYEKEGFADVPISEIISDINYIKQKYVTSPYYLHIDNKPVVFIYNADTLPSPLADAQKWNDVRSQTNIYTVLKVIPNYQQYTNLADSWHQYAPTIGFEQQGIYSAFISPGYNKWHEQPRLTREDFARWENNVSQLKNANVQFKLIETWNEWGEGTGIEPAQLINHDDINPNGFSPIIGIDSYGTKYIDILAKYFYTCPSLGCNIRIV